MLTNETLTKLEAPFPIEDHKIRWDGNVYLTELPLIKRLTSVDLNWEFRITSTIVTDYNLTRPDCVIVSAELTICGITRAGVGSAIADVSTKDRQGKQLTTPVIRALAEKELKGAATDALKRCARQFGVGAYILLTNKANIRNQQDFANWYNREFGKPQQPSAPVDPDDYPRGWPQNSPKAMKKRQEARDSGNKQQPASPPSELDAELSGPEPDTRARDLAIETFPFDQSVKYFIWHEFITKADGWNNVFWAAVAKIGLEETDVHDALNVSTVKAWNGGNVARLWLRLCEERIALDDLAEKANES